VIRLRRWSALAGAGAVIFVVAAGCSGGGDGRAAPTASVGETITVIPGAVTVSSAGPQVAVDDVVRDQMVDTVKRYVQAATVDPLHTGRAGRVAPIFTAAAAARADGGDRAVLVDEGLPAATADITATTEPVGTTVLADQNGTLVLATASLDLTAATSTAKGPVQIHRVGSLTLAPDAGAWKVAGFDLAVSRTGRGVDATAKKSASATTSTRG